VITFKDAIVGFLKRCLPNKTDLFLLNQPQRTRRNAESTNGYLSSLRPSAASAVSSQSAVLSSLRHCILKKTLDILVILS